MKPGPGRPTKAAELGLAALIDKAWPIDEQQRAIRTIADIITGGASSNKDKIAALRLLLEYKFGKPAQVVEHSGSVDINKPVAQMTDEELRRLLGNE